MVKGVTMMLSVTVFGAVMGMLYQGYCLTVINAPAAAVTLFIKDSHYRHYGVELGDSNLNTLFTVITTAFVVGALPGTTSDTVLQ